MLPSEGFRNKKKKKKVVNEWVRYADIIVLWKTCKWHCLNYTNVAVILCLFVTILCIVSSSDSCQLFYIFHCQLSGNLHPLSNRGCSETGLSWDKEMHRSKASHPKREPATGIKQLL